MKKKLALIMTISLLLTSISPVNAAGAEAIEDVEEETLSVSFAEDAGRKSSRRDQKQHCGIHKKVI